MTHRDILLSPFAALRNAFYLMQAHFLGAGDHLPVGNEQVRTTPDVCLDHFGGRLGD